MTRPPDLGPIRWFWAGRVTKPCPDCGHPTSVGFDRADPGVVTREPTRCVQCTAAEINNAIQFSRGELGYPLTEQGPCASCGGPTRLYGPKGSPKCGACASLKAAPKLSPAPEPSPAGPRLHLPANDAQPEPLQPEPEPELDLDLSA